MTPVTNQGPVRGVVFVCSQLGVGGVERLWAQLLPAIADTGMPVKLVAVNRRGETYDGLRAGGLDVTFLGADDGIKALRSVSQLVRIINQSSPSAIISFGASSFALSALAGRISRTPNLVNWHRGNGLELQKTSALACRASAKLGSGVICVSDANIPDLLELGFPRKRIRVVANGVPEPSAALGQDRERHDEVRVVLAARLAPEKRVDRFIEAVAIAAKAIPGLTATVAGQGPLLGELEALRDRLEAPVELIGLHPEPTDLMLMSDIVCLTSDFETAPVSLMEAAACGRPVVTTGVGGIPQMVDDGSTGLIANEASAQAIAELLVKLASDQQLREQLGNNAKARWKRDFSLDAMVSGYLNLVRSVEGPPASWPTGH